MGAMLPVSIRPLNYSRTSFSDRSNPSQKKQRYLSPLALLKEPEWPRWCGIASIVGSHFNATNDAAGIPTFLEPLYMTKVYRDL